MQANTDRIQTTYVGSLVRPPELVAYMRKRLEREAIDDVAYERYLREAVSTVVGRQVTAGLTVVNDGEYSKSSWYRYVTERLDGLEFRSAPSERPRPTPSAGRDFERFPRLLHRISSRPASQRFGRLLGSDRSHQVPRPGAGAA